jgi:hypothetical protein
VPVGERPSMWVLIRPGLVTVWVGVAVHGVVREFTSSPRMGRYSNPICRVARSPMSSTSPCRVSPDDSATEPVVCTWGGVKEGSAFGFLGFVDRRNLGFVWVSWTGFRGQTELALWEKQNHAKVQR